MVMMLGQIWVSNISIVVTTCVLHTSLQSTPSERARIALRKRGANTEEKKKQIALFLVFLALSLPFRLRFALQPPLQASQIWVNIDSSYIYIILMIACTKKIAERGLF